MLIDSWGREITYLRISVTDRCNLRCVYCMPPEGIQWKPREEILSFAEITRIVTAAAGLGIRSVRLTGGEPLVRRDFPELVSMLCAIPGITDISLTTNGTLLEKLAGPLAQAGLRRVNISLDTLDPEKFAQITRGGKIDQVWRGISAAEAAGLQPLKINSVIVRGVNSDELLQLASLSREHAWHIRFIEVMPIGNQGDWGPGFPTASERYLSIHEIKNQLSALNIQPASSPAGNGPAKTYQIPGGKGTIGFISPIGEHFCSNCNRIRLTADGHLRTCLASNDEINVREAIRQGDSLEELIRRAVSQKPEHHQFGSSALFLPDSDQLPSSRIMAQIGG
jgi:GTP 3',8-cyclase